MKVDIAKIGDAKVLTELYRDIPFPSSFSVQKVKGVVGKFQCIYCIHKDREGWACSSTAKNTFIKRNAL